MRLICGCLLCYMWRRSPARRMLKLQPVSRVVRGWCPGNGIASHERKAVTFWVSKSLHVAPPRYQERGSLCWATTPDGEAVHAPTFLPGCDSWPQFPSSFFSYGSSYCCWHRILPHRQWSDGLDRVTKIDRLLSPFSAQLTHILRSLKCTDL